MRIRDLVRSARGVRWNRVSAAEASGVRAVLASWPCEVGGAVRHMFPLAALESEGPSVMRTAAGDGRWAACLVMPGRVVVPCGDPDVVAAAGTPVRGWRLLVGDAAPAEALLEAERGDSGLRIHVQRFMTVDAERVPSTAEVPDPGLRPAVHADLPGLTDLAVRLHVDDGFGPDPGVMGRRGYAERLRGSIGRDSVYCAGPVGRPFAKLERSVSSARYGVQLAGIVVSPELRGRGVGRALVAAAVRQAWSDFGDRPVSLHVREANAAALRAYAAAGFVDREEWRLAVRV